MAKFIYFNIPSTGHVNPSLPVIQKLVEAGQEVIYVNAPELQDKIEATGARFIPYPQSDANQAFLNNITVGNFARNALTLIQIGARSMPFISTLVEREKPDIIMHDSLASWGKLAAQKHGLRTIGFCTTFAMHPRMNAQLPKKAIATTVLQAARLLPEYLAVSRQMRREHHVKPIGLMQALSCFGDMTLVFTAPEFQPEASLFDDTFKFIGPALAARHDDTALDLDDLTGSPLVYISLGTVVNANMAFYRTCFEAFGNQPGQYILSIGRQNDINTLGNIPENFVVRNYVPQLDILQRADVFVTHAGLNSTHEGLVYGVPLVTFPQQMEQAMVAGQVVKNRAGVGIGLQPPYGQTDAAALRQAVQAVLADDSYRQRAKYLGDALRAAGGAERGVEEILKFVDAHR